MRLDVDDIRIVINLDYPLQAEDYIHRIGRTARSGAKGTAYSFFTRENAKQAPELIQILKDSNQDVNEKLAEMSKMRYFGGGSGRGGGGFRGSKCLTHDCWIQCHLFVFRRIWTTWFWQWSTGRSGKQRFRQSSSSLIQ